MLLVTLLVTLVAGPMFWTGELAAQSAGDTVAAAPSCQELELYHVLDFWVGEWIVRAGGARVGENRIERIMGGCALMEHWSSVQGGEGTSLFYVDPRGQWRQVWVTTAATRPGGTKEKRLVEQLPGGGVRFQAELPLPDGGTYLDRTTLTPVGDGMIRQVIESRRMAARHGRRASTARTCGGGLRGNRGPKPRQLAAGRNRPVQGERHPRRDFHGSEVKRVPMAPLRSRHRRIHGKGNVCARAGGS